MSSAPALDRAALARTLLVAGAMAVVLAAVSDRAFELDRFFAPKELVVHVVALAAWLLVRPEREPLRLGWAEKGWLAFVAVSALSALLATNGWVAARAVALSASGVMLLWCARGATATSGRMSLLTGIATATVVGSATALAQAYGLDSALLSLSRAPGGTFGNRNFMAHVAAMGVPLLVSLALASRSAWGAVAATAGLTIHAAALVLSRTRAAWLALALWLLLAVLALAWAGPLWRSRGFVVRLAALTVAVGGGIAAALTLPNALDWRSDSPYLESARGVVNYREGSGAGRLKQWANSARLASRAPLLGVGPGNWAVRYPEVARSGDPSLLRGTRQTANPWPSSDWVAALSERGVVGLSALLLAMVGLVWRGWRRWRDVAVDGEPRLLAMGAAGMLVVTAVEGAFDAVLLLGPPTYVALVTAGAALPLAAPDRRPLPVIAARAVLTVVVGLAVLGTALSVGRVQAMRAYATGTLTAMQRAVRWDPGNARLHARLAGLYAARGECVASLEHAERARRLFPSAGLSRASLGRCILPGATEPRARTRGSAGRS